MSASRPLTPEGVARKLEEFNGNMAAVARDFGVNRVSVWQYVQKRPELLQICADAREGMKDHAESSLYRALLAGEAWAVCFFLKCQAKDRGYIEKNPDEDTIRMIQTEMESLRKILREDHGGGEVGGSGYTAPRIVGPEGDGRETDDGIS